MIQLATDPKASRTGWRATPAEEARRASAPRRSGRSWPFLSNVGERPQAPDTPRKPRNDSGS